LLAGSKLAGSMLAGSMLAGSSSPVPVLDSIAVYVPGLKVTDVPELGASAAQIYPSGAANHCSRQYQAAGGSEM